MTSRQTDWVPAIVLLVVGCVVTFTVTSTVVTNRYETPLNAAFHEQRMLVERFAGQEKSSLSVEEWLIRDFFSDRRDGTFLDVGANHYRELSNTFYLETVLGWSGLAIEPQVEYAADYEKHRPQTRFVAMFASDVDDARITLFVPPNFKANASASQDFAGEYAGRPTNQTEVPTTTLNRVLNQAGINRLDFLSMDIELHEPQALAGFDIDKYRPELVCIESHFEVRQQILDYFQQHNYSMIGRYLRADFDNLYFTPRKAAR